MLASILLIVNSLWNFDSSQWNIKNYTIKDGLNSNRVYDFVRDHRGRYWLGSNAGIAYFDGYQFRYLGSENGLKQIDILDLYYANKHLYSVTVKKIEAIDVHVIGPSFKTKEYDYHIMDRLGCECTDNSFNYYLRNRVFVFHGLDLKIFKLDLPYYHTNSHTFRSLRIDCQNQFHSKYIDSIQWLLKENFYLTGNKLLKLDQSNQLKIYYDFKRYLNYNNFLLIDSNFFYFDELAKTNQSLYNLNQGRIQTFTKIDKVLAFDLYQNNGFFLTTYKNGIYLYTLKQYKKKNYSQFDYTSFYNQEHYLNEYRPYDVDKNVKKQGQMYEFYYKNQWTAYPMGIKSYIKLNDNEFWIGRREGTVRYIIGDNHTTKLPTFIDSSWVLRLKKFDNKLFILNYDNFKILEGKTKRLLKLKYKNGYVLVNDIDYFQNQYILGTNDQGIFISDTGFKKFKHISVEDGLQSKLVKRIKTDKDGHIWVLNDKGLDRINKDLTVTKVFSIAEIDDYEVENFSVTRDSLWLFTDNYVYSANYKVRFQKKKIPIVFNTLTVDNNKTYYEADTNICIGPRWEIIKINFAGIFIHEQEHIAYKYRLVKNEDTGSWQTTKINELTLAALKAGDYQLQVKAYHDIYPNIHSEILTISWTILPYFYQTWWFFTLLFLGLLAIIIGILWYKNQIKLRELKLESELNKYKLHGLQNQMNPHFIFNSMSTIQNMILNDDNKEALDFISDFSSLMRTMLQNSRNDEISLVNELDFLNKYIQLEKIRYKDNFDYKINSKIDEFDLEDIYIPTMMVQPLLENAVKHGVSNLKDKSGRIVLELSFEDENEHLLCIHIIDNGFGNTRSQIKNHTSTALQVIQERLSIYSKNNIFGSLNINYTEKGTTCILKIPV